MMMICFRKGRIPT